MSLMALSEKNEREQDEMFLEQMAELAASEEAPELATPEAEPDSSGTGPEDLAPAPVAPLSGPSAASGPAAADPDALNQPAAADPEDEIPEKAAPSTPPPTRPSDEDIALPAGVPERAAPLQLSEEDRVALLAETGQGSVGDGGSAVDFLNGLPARPSVESQREIQAFRRRLVGDLELKTPLNWPEHMMIPTYEESRVLQHPNTTPENIRAWEEEKQRAADAMEARAKELNAWIFSFGDMRLNEKHQMARSKNRDAAIKKRTASIDGKEAISSPASSPEITDEELYKDRHYGILFASLLNPSPDHLNRLQQAPVAAWGHDIVRTLDGGRVKASRDEIRALTVTAQAAQVIVMEAKARGWETFRISGDNEFCAAVKRACKEQGMGAIITRRGPLGLGPFSRPEYIMPRLPQSLGPQMPDPEQRRKEQGAPTEDGEAARRLLDQGAPGQEKGPSGPKTGQARPTPDPTDGVPRDEAPSPESPEAETERGPRPGAGPARPRLDEVEVRDPTRPNGDPGPAPEEDWTPIQRI